MGQFKAFDIERMNKAAKDGGIDGLIKMFHDATVKTAVLENKLEALDDFEDKLRLERVRESQLLVQNATVESPSGWTPLLFRDDQNGSAQWILSLTNQSSGDDMRFRLDVNAVMKLSDLAEAELVAADFFADPPSGHDDDQEGF